MDRKTKQINKQTKTKQLLPTTPFVRGGNKPGSLHDPLKVSSEKQSWLQGPGLSLHWAPSRSRGPAFRWSSGQKYLLPPRQLFQVVRTHPCPFIPSDVQPLSCSPAPTFVFQWRIINPIVDHYTIHNDTCDAQVHMYMAFCKSTPFPTVPHCTLSTLPSW